MILMDWRYQLLFYPPLSTWDTRSVAFFVDEYTLAFGFQDGRIFEKLTIGDEEWKPMADSSVVNKNIRQVCQFGDEFVILGSGESHPTCFEHFEPERKLPIAGTDSRGSQIYDAKADQWSDGTRLPTRGYTTTCVPFSGDRALMVGGALPQSPHHAFIYDHRNKEFIGVGTLEKLLKEVRCVPYTLHDGSDVIFCSHGATFANERARGTYIFDIKDERWERRSEWDLPAAVGAYKHLYIIEGKLVLNQGFEFRELERSVETDSHWHPRGSEFYLGLVSGWPLKILKT